MQVTAVYSNTVHIVAEGAGTQIQREQVDPVCGQKESNVQTQAGTQDITDEYFKVDGYQMLHR
jgi:hypothetical protein